MKTTSLPAVSMAMIKAMADQNEAENRTIFTDDAVAEFQAALCAESPGLRALSVAGTAELVCQMRELGLEGSDLWTLVTLVQTHAFGMMFALNRAAEIAAMEKEFEL
jgi:hypothetical protein